VIAAGVLWAPGGVEQNCHLCQDPEHGPALRKQWGCDEPTEHVQLLADCIVCGGKSPTCKECKGTGKIEYFRCPNTLVTRDCIEVCRHTMLVEAGFLPVAGGVSEQAAVFIDALGIARSELAVYKKRALEKDAGK